MKRRNAESGKMRRPLKRTKIAEGMYGNSMLYLKFVMLWATIVLADYMLEFRFEFLWPFWMMLRSVYDSFKYQGLAFSVFFICIALTSDMICFFFMPLPFMFIAASTYVWVQCFCYTVADRVICVPTVVLCCLIAYVEGALREAARGGGLEGGGLELCRPLAAHCVGYPVVTFGFGVKSYVGHRLRLRRQRQVRAQNEYYYQLLREALPESALEENQNQSESSCAKAASKESERVPNGGLEPRDEHRHMNGHAPASKTKKCSKGLETNGHCPHEHSVLQFKNQPESSCAKAASKESERVPNGGGPEPRDEHRHMNGHAPASRNKKCSKGIETNGHCPHEHSVLQFKLEKLEKHLAAKEGLSREKSSPTLGNGSVTSPLESPLDDDVRHEPSKASAKSTKCDKKETAASLREEKRRNRNKDKDKDKDITDSHKNTEQTKEIVKEAECTKENNSAKSNCNHTIREKERDSERERMEREREREQRLSRECSEELKRVRAELTAARAGEAEARRALAAAAAAERARRADHTQLRHAHQQLQHKLSTWRGTERAALERRLGEERRARHAAELQLQQQTAKLHNGECTNEWCVSRRSTSEAESAALRRELARSRERAQRSQRDLQHASDQIRALEATRSESSSPRMSQSQSQQSQLQSALQSLQERSAHLERALSAETRVKLDLLSALGEAKRQLHIREGLIAKQEKEMEELKAQMLAVMPTDFMSPVGAGAVSKLRRAEGSPLDPNASVYTPKQLCSDA